MNWVNEKKNEKNGGALKESKEEKGGAIYFLCRSSSISR